MNLSNKKVVLTGAGGGIGQRLALALAAKGAHLVLVDRNLQALSAVCRQIADGGGFAQPIVADLSTAAGVADAAELAQDVLGGLDVLINNAGLMDFVRFDQQDEARIEQIIRVNVTAPLLMSRAVLPHLLAQNSGRIVNIGSAFGSIGFAHYASYCASKFALRGFSEALRRELADSEVGVTYIAPRATRTALNDDVATRMMQATDTRMDSPQHVAELIARAIERERKEYFIGQPESFFARLNALLPRLVDLGLRKQTRVARQFTEINPVAN